MPGKRLSAWCGWPVEMPGPWPSPIEERVLTAGFGAEDDARAALASCIDAAGTPRLLPFVERRWGAQTPPALAEIARRVYLTSWRQNHERMAQLGLVLGAFRERGIDCLLLKGAALVLRHYRDYGLRDMADFDLLIRTGDLQPAVRVLLDMGWTAEEGCTPEAILRQARVRHAWQFSRGEEASCDLHWRPVARCFSPLVSDSFWNHAETGDLAGVPLKFPSATEQLFHISVHAMQWDWKAHTFWVADALTVLNGSQQVDWDRVRTLAEAARMQARLYAALEYLGSHFPAPVPKRALAAPRWERREYELLLKPCPLGMVDSIAWHIYNFRRLRPFDAGWKRTPVLLGFPQYLAAFLDVSSWAEFGRKLCAQVRARGQGDKGTSGQGGKGTRGHVLSR